jgi:hypothetical protein
MKQQPCYFLIKSTQIRKIACERKKKDEKANENKSNFELNIILSAHYYTFTPFDSEKSTNKSFIIFLQCLIKHTCKRSGGLVCFYEKKKKMFASFSTHKCTYSNQRRRAILFAMFIKQQ